MTGSSFIAEGYARQRVPDDQLGSGRRVFFIVAGALCGLPVYVLSSQVVNGLGYKKARYAFLLGGILAGTLGAVSAYIGAKTRMNLGMLADEAFGTTGGRIVKTVIALSLIGWVGVILSVLGATAGSAVNSLYGLNLNSQWIAVVAGLAVAVITLRGVQGLEYIGLLIAPLLCALLAWTFYKGCPGNLSPGLASPGGTLGFGAAVSAVVGEYVVGIVIQPDYGRFVRRPLGAGMATGLALGVAFPAILILSAIPTFKCSASDLISVMVTVGIGLPALVLLVLGAWTDASACLYSGSLSLTNEVKQFRLPWVTTASAAIGCLFAILHAERQFMPFLAILGVAFPPVAAVNIMHVLLNSRRTRDSRPELPRVRWVAVSAWICGSLTGYLSGNAYFTLSGIASIDSILAAAFVWMIAHLTRDREARPTSSGTG
jgi:cytosine permease